MTGDESTAAIDDGVVVSNLLCQNDHGDSGQVMERRHIGGYECPECGRTAGYRLEWSDPDE